MNQHHPLLAAASLCALFAACGPALTESGAPGSLVAYGRVSVNSRSHGRVIVQTHPRGWVRYNGVVRDLVLEPLPVTAHGWIVQTDPRADDALAAAGTNCARRGRVPPPGTLVVLDGDASDGADGGDDVRLLGARPHRTRTLAMRTPSTSRADRARRRAARRARGCSRPTDPCFDQDGDDVPGEPTIVHVRGRRGRRGHGAADLADNATDSPADPGADDNGTPARGPRPRNAHGAHGRDTAADAPGADTAAHDGEGSPGGADADGTDHPGGANDAAARAHAAATPRHRRALAPRERRALDRMVRAGRARRPREAAGLEAAARRVADSAEDGGVTFAGIPIVGRRVVLVVDVSYSMREPAPRAFNDGLAAEATKLDMVRAQLTALLAALPADVEINVVAFSSARRAMFDRPRTLDDAALDQAADWIANLAPEDETHPLDAVRAADAMGADQIILVTDGRPTYAESEEPALLEFATGLPRAHHRLDVVGLGPEQNASFLDTLAARGRGQAAHF